MTIICFSHLRWNFVYQRPQHLLSRFAKNYTVYFIEEPIFHEDGDCYTILNSEENVHVIKQYLSNKDDSDVYKRQHDLLKIFLQQQAGSEYIFWYYSPMMYLFSKQFDPALIVYDCMDELSAFKFAPAGLKETEQELFDAADVVFTGGHSLYQAKKHLHHNIYPFPSSIEKEHFAKARINNQQPADQQNIPYPRLGFFGVLDERFDIELIREVATKKPEWNFILLGPIVKINPDDLPHNANIFYLGGKSYNELPAYVSGWDIALVPFALNESTRYISPTKTPEYLAAGKPVISTAITDVVNPYGEENLASIIHSAEEFIKAAEKILKQENKNAWLKKVDAFLKNNSWDNTFAEMNGIIKKGLAGKKQVINSKTTTYV